MNRDNFTQERIDWGSLSHNIGSASDIPHIVARLQSASTRDEAAESAWELNERLCHGGLEVVDATAPAIQILWSLVADQSFHWRHYVVQFIDCVAVVRGVYAPPLAPRGASAEYACRIAIQKGIGLVAELAEHAGDVNIRGSCIELLGDAGEAEEVIRRFSIRLASENDPSARADLAAAMAAAAIRTEESAERAAELCADLLADESAAVRFRVARVILRARPTGVDLEHAESVLDTAYSEVRRTGGFRDEYA
ncbi:hypothetical protein ACFHYQ_22580 [Sphaerimonospora cavernae]|uniref:HEAT repeat protein n=1 Tax=Sphaerimonospora cavernae TaxID=1740611 RepID=A0ABV6UA96_9ACTN